MRRRQVVKRLQSAYEVSERRACRAISVARSSHRYQSCRDLRAELRIRLRDLAASRVRYGYRRLHTLLRREGWEVNHKLVYRLYLEADADQDAPPPQELPGPCRAAEGGPGERELEHGLHARAAVRRPQVPPADASR